MHYFTYSADVTRCPRTNFTKWMISSRTREVLSVIPRSSKSRLLGLTWIHPGNLSPNLPLPARTHCLWTLIGNWTNTCWLVLDLVDNWAGEPCSGVLGYIHRRIKMAYVTTVISHLLCAGGINIGLCDFLFLVDAIYPSSSLEATCYQKLLRAGHEFPLFYLHLSM